MFINCLTCNKKFLTYLSAIKVGKKYCSKKCYQGPLGIDKNCLYCGKIFHVWKSRLKDNRGKFCSKQCSFEYGRPKGKNSPRWNSILISCNNCGKKLYKNPAKILHGKIQFCSIKCHYSYVKNNKLYVGKNNPSWKGGKYETQGYVMIYKPNHHMLGKNRKHIQEHRLIAEKCLNRYLIKEERIHHINGIKNDNRPENLYLFNCEKEHNIFHAHPYQLTSNII